MLNKEQYGKFWEKMDKWGKEHHPTKQMSDYVGLWQHPVYSNGVELKVEDGTPKDIEEYANTIFEEVYPA